MATLDSKLLKLRKEHRFSQSEIAKKIGVSQNAYCKWEAGKSIPGTENIKKISVFYDVDVRYLLDDKKNGDNDIVAAQNSTINIPISVELFEKALQNQKNIIKMSEMQLKIFEKLAY